MKTLQGAADRGASCWCCGERYDVAEMVHLGAHPEVTVCFKCAHDLGRRAKGARDRDRTSPAASARRSAARVRGQVIERGWHRLPVIGGVLQRIDRYLP